MYRVHQYVFMFLCLYKFYFLSEYTGFDIEILICIDIDQSSFKLQWNLDLFVKYKKVLSCAVHWLKTRYTLISQNTTDFVSYALLIINQYNALGRHLIVIIESQCEGEARCVNIFKLVSIHITRPNTKIHLCFHFYVKIWI